MANVKEIKRRIKSVQNIQQITRAMKMVAAARIKKIERMLRSRRPYCEKLYEIIGEILAQLDQLSHPLLETRKECTKTALLVVAGDKGLCGSYNMNLIRSADRFMRHLVKEGKHPVLYVAGSKAYRHLSRKGYTIGKHYLSWEPAEAVAEDMAHLFGQEFINGTFDELHCIYTRSTSLMSMKVTQELLLPLRRAEQGGRRNTITLFEPEPELALDSILPVYIKENIMRILLDAKTTELSARIKAMSNATENAEGLVDELKLTYFRARQESITTELLEIVSGGEVLQRGR